MNDVSERQLIRPDGLSLPYQLTRMRRKTLSLRVNERGLVDVRIPHRATLAETERFLSNKLAWIDAQLAKWTPIQHRSPLPSSSDQLLWRGEHLAVRYSQVHAPTITPQTINLPDTITPAALKIWANRVAPSILHERIETILPHFHQVTQRLNLARHPNSWKLHWVKSRWGSCNNKGDIHLNLRLCVFPNHLIDAVIFHELTHLFVFNHSAAFYQLLAQFDPHHRRHSLELKKLNHTTTAQLTWHWLAK